MKRRKRWIWITIAVVGALVIWLLASRGESEGTKERSITAVERGPITMAVSTTGRVVANLDVEIKCKASGRVTALPRDVSDQVKEGDLLVELDPIDEERRAKRAEVALSASRAQLEQARQNLIIAQRSLETDKRRAAAALVSARTRAEDLRAKANRAKQLMTKNLSSREEYDTARTAAVAAEADLENARLKVEDLKTQEIALEIKRQQVRQAEAQVQSDDIALADARQRLKDTKVYAPINGVVSGRNVEIGQIVSSGINNVGGGTRLLTVSDLSRTYILAAVDESDIGKVAAGQAARITADAYPGEAFRGRVARIATRGESSSNVVTFEVKIEVLGENRPLLKPEMTANVEIVAARRKEALLVPIGAIARRGGKHFASVEKAGGTLEERPVRIGITDGANTEVLEGLAEGERVAANAGASASRWRKETPRRSHGPRMFMRPSRKKKQ